MTLDKIDQQLLQLLQENARMNIKELAEEIGMSKTPIYERIKRLEREGVIDKYVALVDRKRLGTSMVVFCSVSLDSQKLENIHAFNTAIAQIPEVMESYLMGGSNDFLLKVVVKDLEAYHQFSSGKLAALPHVSQIKSTFVLNEVKKSTVLPVV
jgi:DNA-binding Lrp family transcriptional regulator